MSRAKVTPSRLIYNLNIMELPHPEGEPRRVMIRSTHGGKKYISVGVETHAPDTWKPYEVCGACILGELSTKNQNDARCFELCGSSRIYFKREGR